MEDLQNSEKKIEPGGFEKEKIRKDSANFATMLPGCSQGAGSESNHACQYFTLGAGAYDANLRTEPILVARNSFSPTKKTGRSGGGASGLVGEVLRGGG
jgi:hypothetical protein